MSFEFNPADEDEHGECRHEIKRLQLTVEYYKNAFRQSRQKDGCKKPAMVPSRIRLPFRISGDWPIGHGTQVGPGDFPCTCNQWGAVTVIAEDGQMLDNDLLDSP